VSASKTERLLNLLIMLLVQRHYVSKDRIREILYADAPSTDAFEKTFERDKEELRSLGVPIEVGQMDAYFDDEPGYRIRADEFALPEISLESDEASVVALATRVWEHARLAEATTDAVGKLTAAGLDLDLEALEIAQPRLSADEPSFDVFWEATLTRRPVTFDYRRPGYDQPLTRHLEPWGVVRFSGRWYVVGQDTDRGEPRMFRLSRIVSGVAADGDSGSYTVPEGTDLRALSESLTPRRPDRTAVVLARPGAANGLRRRAEVSATGVTGPDGTLGWDELQVPYVSESDFAGELLGYADAVVVESPAELRSAVSSRLAGVVDADPAGARR
jgi:proteasome accessory factor B